MGKCGGCGPECNGPCSRRAKTPEGSERYGVPVGNIINEMQDNAHGTPTAEEVIEYIRNYRAMQKCNCENCQPYA